MEASELARPLSLTQRKRLFELLALHQRYKSLEHLQEQIEVLEFEGFLPPLALAPREETLELVDLLARRAAKKKELQTRQRLSILELGCGAGLLLGALSLRLRRYGLVMPMDLYFSDLEPAWVAAAKKNLASLCEDFRAGEVTLEGRQGSWWQPWQEFHARERARREKGFDLILCNPPYISYEDACRVDLGVWLDESHQALFAPDQAGLCHMEEIAKGIEGYLNQGGLLGLEMGDRQAEQVKALFVRQAPRFGSQGKVLRDLEGKKRFFLIDLRSA